MKHIRQSFIVMFFIISMLAAALPGAFAQDSVASDFSRCLATPNQEGCRAGLPAGHYQMLLDEMMMRPEPEVRQLPVNDTEMRKYAYRRLISTDGTTFYNAP
ncbi:MAG TPA: hypothetical protein VJZ27_02990, partial [Aggregatilineales bacterium]|nr:hypothetical protein [Aggregatilineales bacterium]